MVDSMHQTNLDIFKHIRTCMQRKYQSTNPDVLENLDDACQYKYYDEDVTQIMQPAQR